MCVVVVVVVVVAAAAAAAALGSPSNQNCCYAPQTFYKWCMPILPNRKCTAVTALFCCNCDVTACFIFLCVFLYSESVVLNSL